ncbi:hypothetical protein ACQFYA_18335 [Promicromonospora sp. Marseille-Q5078]
MTLGTKGIIAASSGVSAALALALTHGSLDADLTGLAWYYGLMFPWATLGTYLVMLALAFVPAADLALSTVQPVVIALAGAIQGALVGAVVLAARYWCIRCRTLHAA